MFRGAFWGALKKSYGVLQSVFLAEAAKEHFDINPVSGAEMQKIVTEIVATPRPIADRLLQIIGGVGENRGG